MTIAIGYIGLISEKQEQQRMVMEIIQISKRIYGAPDFVFYAITDGLFTVFTRCKTGIAHMLRKKPKPLQMSLFSDIGFG